jgi:hypothetical protein
MREQPQPEPAFDAMRTICISNLAPDTTHSDITSVIRGGLILDLYVRYRENWAAVSFYSEHDARAFFDYVQKHGLYVKQKQVSGCLQFAGQYNLDDP